MHPHRSICNSHLDHVISRNDFLPMRYISLSKFVNYLLMITVFSCQVTHQIQKIICKQSLPTKCRKIYLMQSMSSLSKDANSNLSKWGINRASPSLEYPRGCYIYLECVKMKCDLWIDGYAMFQPPTSSSFRTEQGKKLNRLVKKVPLFLMHDFQTRYGVNISCAHWFWSLNSTQVKKL